MYGGFYGSGLIFVLPAMLFAAYAQMKITSSYEKFSRMDSGTGYSGAQVARIILDRNGLNHINVVSTPGKLTDHYDPRTKVVRLSESIFRGSSVASMSVAAHEVGHAIQHDTGYFPLVLRSNIAPLVSFSSRLVWPMIFLGILISEVFFNLGILLFAGVVAFQVITLPVEFNASRRALLQLEDGIARTETISGAKSMLNAAALTYVASTLVALGQLLRLIGMSDRRR